MKKAPFLFALLFCVKLYAQDTVRIVLPTIAIKWAPTGLLLGSLSLQGEYNFGDRNSLTAKIGLPITTTHRFTFDEDNVNFRMKAMSFLAGYRTYLSKKHMKGFYFEPFFHYVHHSSEGQGTANIGNRKGTFQFTNEFNSAGIGVQLGVQFLVGKRFVIDLFFLGPEINSASNSFRAAEASNVPRWTHDETKDAENSVREFLDQFPIIRNKTAVMIDAEMKRVSANFRGALPAVRTGFSVGFTF